MDEDGAGVFVVVLVILVFFLPRFVVVVVKVSCGCPLL